MAFHNSMRRGIGIDFSLEGLRFGGFISFPSPGLKDLSVALTQRRDTP